MQVVKTASLVSDRSRNFGDGLEAILVISDKEFVSVLFRPKILCEAEFNGERLM